MVKFTAYCKVWCPHSNQTATLLDVIKQSGDDVKIIPIQSDNWNVNSIDYKPCNKSKQEFFQYVEKTEGIKINGHSTFPINIFEASNGQKYYIGGNDVFQSIYKKAESTLNVSTLKPHDMCIHNFVELDTEGQRRLFCHFLKLFKKIKN